MRRADIFAHAAEDLAGQGALLGRGENRVTTISSNEVAKANSPPRQDARQDEGQRHVAERGQRVAPSEAAARAGWVESVERRRDGDDDERHRQGGVREDEAEIGPGQPDATKKKYMPTAVMTIGMMIGESSSPTIGLQPRSGCAPGRRRRGHAERPAPDRGRQIPTQQAVRRRGARRRPYRMSGTIAQREARHREGQRMFRRLNEIGTMIRMAASGTAAPPPLPGGHPSTISLFAALMIDHRLVTTSAVKSTPPSHPNSTNACRTKL